MPVTPYHVNFQGKQYAFERAEDMVFFLLNKQEDIDIFYMNSAKITCDLNKGSVIFNDSVKVTAYITNTFFFDKENKSRIISSIAQMISLVAKLHLLEKISELNDGQLSKLIKANYFHSSDFINKGYTINNMQKKIDKLLKQLFAYAAHKNTPVQIALHDTFSMVGIDNIKSRNDAEKIINLIRGQIEQQPKRKLSH